MNIFIKSSALLIIVSLAGCSSSTEKSIDKEGIADEIATSFSSFVGAMNRLSIDELKEFYSDDPRFYWTEGGRIQYADKASLTASLDGLVQSLKSSDLKILQTKIEVLDEKSVILFAEYEQALVMQSDFGFVIDGAMTVLLQKKEGQWKFLIGHSSTKKQRGG